MIHTFLLICLPIIAGALVVVLIRLLRIMRDAKALNELVKSLRDANATKT